MISIKQRLYTAFGCIFLCLLLTVGMGLWATLSLTKTTTKLLEEDVVVYNLLNDIAEKNLEHRIAWREVITALESTRLEEKLPFSNRLSEEKIIELETSLLEASTALGTLAKNLDKEDVEHITTVATDLKKMIESSSALLKVVHQGDNWEPALKELARLKEIMITTINTYLEHKHKELDADKVEMLKFSKHLVGILGSLGVIASVLVIVLSIRSSNYLLKNLRDIQLKTIEMSNCEFVPTVVKDGSKCELLQVKYHLNEMCKTVGETIKGVKEKACEAAGFSANLVTSTKEASTASQDQSGKIMQVSASVEELNVSIAEVSSSSIIVRELSSNSAKEAADGVVLTEAMLHQMDKIVEQSQHSADDVGKLQEAANSITKFTKDIKDIADQTNLLALNAAIEAARAGDTGRGFAVVADEVRKLAERTTHTTQEIAVLANQITKEVTGTIEAITNISDFAKKGKDTAVQSNDILQKVVAATKQVESSVHDIASASQEQRMAADSTAQAMEGIATTAEENDAVIASVDSLSQAIQVLSDNLDQLTRKFKTT